MNNNIAAIGTTTAIKMLHFCGISQIFLTDDIEKIEKIIDELAKKQTSIIFIEEQILEKIPQTVLKYKNNKTPSITALPTIKTNSKNPYENSVLYNQIKKIVGEEINI